MLGTFYTLLSIFLAMAAVVHLLLHKRQPYSTITWLLFVLLVPIVGPVFFFLLGPQRLERKAAKRKADITEAISPPAFSVESLENTILSREEKLTDEDQNIFRLGKHVSHYPVTEGNVLELLPDAQQALLAMQSAIHQATSFIHMEYYIIASDDVTKLLFEDLLRARERGVEVRILYDSLGSLSLKRIFFRNLIEKGVKVAGFLPLSILPQRFHLNFRNHRKILIVDGKVAFTGGTNIGKEYLGTWYANQWRDYTVKVLGPACQQLQDVFARDWHFTTQEDLFRPKYYPTPTKAGRSLVQVLDSGPDTQFRSLHQTICFAIHSARESILLTTPYFVPDEAMLSALTVAALRGIKTMLLFPSKSDAPLVQLASHSFYEELLQAGVSIYEYQPKILHAKLLVIDGKWSILGSANMDIRSFKLNFELNLLIYGKEVASQCSQIFENDRMQSRKIELDLVQGRSKKRQMLENFCRLFSPIL